MERNKKTLSGNKKMMPAEECNEYYDCVSSWMPCLFSSFETRMSIILISFLLPRWYNGLTVPLLARRVKVQMLENSAAENKEKSRKTNKTLLNLDMRLICT